MADRKISDLTALTTPAAGDYLPIIDISEPLAANKNKRITIEELLRGAPDGTAGAPGFAFESDPDSGLYSTGANGVALSTGGTGRLFVDASGNVGLGITPVANTLLGGARGSSLPGLIELAGNGNTVGSSGFAIGQDGSGVATLFQRANAAMYFATNGSERLRITSTGQLSHIGAGSSGSPAVSFNGSAPSNSLVITSAGLVGIGTSSPASVLDAAGDVSITGNENYLYLYSTYSVGSNSRVRIRAVGAGGGSGYGGDFRLSTRASNNTWNTDAFVVDSSGRVGIGTTSPGGGLHVKRSASGGQVILDNAGEDYTALDYYNNGTRKAAVQYRNSENLLRIDAFAASSQIAFRTVDTERARIDSSGRLLVGTSTTFDQSAPLQVNSSTGYSANLYVFGADNSQVNIGSARGSVGSPSTLNSSDTIGGIYFRGHDGTSFKTGAQIQAQIDGITPSSDLPSRLVFSVTADGAASPTEALRISSNRAITVSDGGNVVLGTTTGTKIGTATTQKLGFYNATPVVQPAAVADATDAATVITQLNDLLAKLRTLGIIAT